MNKKQKLKVERMQNNCSIKNKESVGMFGKGLGRCCGHLPAIKALQASSFGSKMQEKIIVKPAPKFRIFLHCPICGKGMGTSRSLEMIGNGRT